MSMTLTPALTRSSAMTTAGTAHLRRRPRQVSNSTAWFMATATMAAANESVTASWVLSRKKTRAVTASTPKQTVKTVLRATWEAGAGPELGIAPLYRSLHRKKAPAVLRRSASVSALRQRGTGHVAPGRTRTCTNLYHAGCRHPVRACAHQCPADKRRNLSENKNE